MKQPYSIFVEGVADKRFISQLITVLFGGNVADDSIIVTDGWKSLVTQAKENLYINQMNKTSDNGGVNMVVNSPIHTHLRFGPKRKAKRAISQRDMARFDV